VRGVSPQAASPAGTPPRTPPRTPPHGGAYSPNTTPPRRGQKQIKVGGRRYNVVKELGKGSFGVVHLAESASGDEPEQVAIKEIVTRSDKDTRQAEFEFEVMRKVAHLQDTPIESPSRRTARLRFPRLIGSETKRDLSGQTRVYGVMESVPGKPLDSYTEKNAPQLPLTESCAMTRALLAQLSPTLERVAEVAIHRDINAHNILVHVLEDGASRFEGAGAGDNEKYSFTLIDFGLAVDMRTWKDGVWRTHDIGGDCRYWPVSSWKQFVHGFKYLEGAGEHCEHYRSMLDVHSLGLTAVQLFASTCKLTGLPPEDPLVKLRQSWDTYWTAATEYWKQLYSVFRHNGDWGALKKDFMYKQVADTTGKNLLNLMMRLEACAKEIPAHKRLFKCLARTLDVEACDWKVVRQFLERAETTAAPKRTHLRRMNGAKTYDSGNWLTRNVEDIAVTKLRADHEEQEQSKEADRPFVPVEGETFALGRRNQHSRIRSADQSSLPIEYRMAAALGQDSPGKKTPAALRKITEDFRAELEESPER